MLRTLALGLCAWSMGCLWPMLAGATVERREVLYAVAALVPLLAGASFVRRRPVWAAASWCAAFPIALSAALAGRPEAVNRHTLGTLPLLLLWLVLCGYGAVAARACAHHAPALPSRTQALNPEPWEAQVAPPSFAQRWLMLACAAGAIALTLLAPTLGGQRSLERAWGEAASAGALLTAVVGGTLGVSVVTVFLGAAFRPAPRSLARADRRSFQVSSALLLALLGLATYLLVTP